jgi:hypothetical protein
MRVIAMTKDAKYVKPIQLSNGVMFPSKTLKPTNSTTFAIRSTMRRIEIRCAAEPFLRALKEYANSPSFETSAIKAGIATAGITLCYTFPV